MGYLELLKHEIVHFLLSILALIITVVIIKIARKKVTRKLLLVSTIGAFIGEFFLDSDHAIDYIIAFGARFNPGFFFSGYMFEKLHKTYVLFHAWEWVVVLAVITYFVKNMVWRYFLVALTIGLFLHLFYDVFYNHFTFQGYSLIYRLLYGFNPDYFTLPD